MQLLDVNTISLFGSFINYARYWAQVVQLRTEMK